MTDNKDDTGKVQPAGASPPKKPTPIIDLRATVIDTVKAAGSGLGKDATNAAPSVEIKPPSATLAGSTAPSPASASPARPADAKSSVPPIGAGAATSAKPSDSAKPSAPAAAPAGRTHAAPPPAPARGGFLSHVAAGLTGAVIALAGASGLAPMLGLDSGSPVPLDVTRRLSALEQGSGKTAASAEAAQRLAATDARLQKLEEAAQALATGQVRLATETKSLEDKVTQPGGSDAAQRVAKLEEQLAQMTAAANADPRAVGRLPQLAQLTTKIGEVETAVVTRTAQLKSELMQQMDQRFTKTGETVETTRSLLNQRTQSVEQTLKTVTDETLSLRTGVDALKADVDVRFRNAAKPADVQTAVAAVTTKLTSLEQNMQGVVKSEQERNATAGNILLSLELANLKRALDRGGKYGSELAAVRTLAGPKLDLTVLDAQKDTGVPSLATLGQELAGLAHGMLDAEAEPADASISDRVLSGFKSIVRVRRVNFAPGDASTEAVIARMEAGLKEGRVADVIDEAKKLPPKAAVPAAQWLQRIDKRAAIDKALSDLDSSLKTALAGGAAPKKGTN